jgi:methylmalonyl-CoA mutase
MDSMYQRGKIQDESLLYETLKHNGTLPIIGVNTFLPSEGSEPDEAVALIRSGDAEKNDQITAVRAFQEQHSAERPDALHRLQEVARARGNVFGELMETVKVASLGDTSGALYAVGGEYRRNM